MQKSPPERHDAPPTGFAVRVAFYFGAIFLLVGSYTPYFPVWLDWRGMSETEISLIFATPLVVRIAFTPAISFAADRLGDPRRILVALSWGTLLTLAALGWTSGFWSIFALSVVFALFWTSVIPLTETVAMDGVKRAGLDYGRMRLWGSLTFILASSGGGLVLERWGSPSALGLLVGAALVLVAGAHLLPRPRGHGRLEAATSPPRIRLADAAALLRSGPFLLFLAATSAIQAGHGVYYTFATLHWRVLDIPDSTIGALWATGVIAEIVLFAWSGWAVARLGPGRLILLGALAAVLRWAVMALDPPLAVLFPLQVLHAFTYGTAHLGAIHLIARTVPAPLSATAQGLYASVTSGLAMGGAMALAGPLYRAYAGGAYLAMAGLGLVACVLTLALLRAIRHPAAR